MVVLWTAVTGGPVEWSDMRALPPQMRHRWWYMYCGQPLKELGAWHPPPTIRVNVDGVKVSCTSCTTRLDANLFLA